MRCTSIQCTESDYTDQQSIYFASNSGMSSDVGGPSRSRGSI